MVNNASTNCSKPEFRCPFVTLVDTVLSKNRATYAGGGIFVSDIDAVRLNCSSDDRSDVTRRDDSDGVIRSADDICPSWKDNRAGVYGPVVGGYATLVKKTVVEDDTEVVEFTGNSFRVPNHENGRALPTVNLMTEDALGQGPAIGANGSTISMEVSSPDEFLPSTSIVSMQGGIGRLSGITGLVPKGNYSVQVRFRGERIEDLVISVHVSGCPIGKALVANGTICTPCDEGTYSLFPDSDRGCRPCPENGDCGSSVIAPKRGYWHPTPCSKHIQRCVSNRACDVESRQMVIRELTRGVRSCEFDVTFARNYSSAQCREVAFTLYDNGIHLFSVPRDTRVLCAARARRLTEGRV